MKILIKNMVCYGTKQMVAEELEKLAISCKKFENSEIELEEDLTLPEIKMLERALQLIGLQVEFKKSKLVSRIRNIVHEMIDNNLILRTGLSKYISGILGYNYYYLNSYFFKETGLAIEEYYVARKENRLRDQMTNKALAGVQKQNIFF